MPTQDDIPTPTTPPAADWRAALRCSLTNGLMLSSLVSTGRLVHQWWQTDRIDFNDDIRFSLIFWFFGGAIIGLISWRQTQKNLASQAQAASDDTPPK
jgi:hypothetical protein